MKTVIATASVVIGFVTALLVYRSTKSMDQLKEMEEYSENAAQSTESQSQVRVEETSTNKKKNWPDDYVDLSGGMLGIF